MTIKAMSDKDYFADPAIDQSGLKQWMISPAKYVASLEQPEDSLTPAGLEIRKNYGRLVSLLDGFKAVRKARTGKENIVA